jgi:hypothetical protein
LEQLSQDAPFDRTQLAVALDEMCAFSRYVFVVLEKGLILAKVRLPPLWEKRASFTEAKR